MRNLAASRSGILTTATRLAWDVRGNATVWNLTWLTGFAIMAGLAIDTTNARRVETQLAATADAAALAGLMELSAPNFGLPYVHGSYGPTVEAAALDYAHRNLETSEHGDYLENADIYVGHWDGDTRAFTWGGEPVNAVHVRLGRNAEKDNRLSTTLLSLIGLDNWEINVAATAAMPLAECFNNGIIAAGTLKINPGAKVYSGCLHGEEGISIQSGVQWWPNTGVSARDGDDVKIQPGQIDETGAPTTVHEEHKSMNPSAMASDVVNIGRALLDLTDQYSSYNPDYREMRVASLQDPNLPVIQMTTFSIGDTVPPGTQAWLDDGVQVASLSPLAGLGGLVGTGAVGTTGVTQFKLGDMRPLFDSSSPTTAHLEEFRTYYAPCTGKLTINGIIRNIALVSECRIEIQTDSVLENVLLVSLDDRPPNAVAAGQGVTFGADDHCTTGGDVRIWANGDFTSSSGTTWQGVQLYVDGDLTLAGQTGAGQGISAHVSGDVHIAALAQIAGLADDMEYVESESTPACVAGVGFDWITSDYLWVLVE